jgi:hypothetical protein
MYDHMHVHGCSLMNQLAPMLPASAVDDCLHTVAMLSLAGYQQHPQAAYPQPGYPAQHAAYPGQHAAYPGQPAGYPPQPAGYPQAPQQQMYR